MPATITVVNGETVIQVGENTAEARRSAQRAQFGSPFPSRADLLAAPGAQVGDRAAVSLADTGTHTDPEDSSTQLNTGIYTYDAVHGWLRYDALDGQYARDAMVAAEAEANRAEIAATGVNTALRSAPSNSGTGIDSIGQAVFEVAAGVRFPLTVFSLDGAGGKRDWIKVDAVRANVQMPGATIHAAGSTFTGLTGGFVAVPGATLAADGRMALAEGFIIRGLGFTDSSNRLIHTLPRADYALPSGALAVVGERVRAVNPKRLPQILHPSASCVVYQGAAMESALPIASRTHQLVPAITKSGGWLYATWYAINGVNDAAYPASEAAGNYVVVARRRLSGGSWTEIARIAPGNMATGRAYDPIIGTTADGRVVVLWAYSERGAVIYHWSAGTWLTVLENPDMEPGGRFVFTPPEFVAYGVPSPPFLWRGELCLPIDVWRRSSNFPSGTGMDVWSAETGVVKGARLHRLYLDGARPAAEAISAPIPSVSPYDDFSETQMVPLDGGRILAHQRTTDGIRAFISTDHTLSAWTGPTDIETDVGGMTTPTRSALIRTAMGYLAWAGNNAGANRWTMTLRLSQDADGVGGTFLWKSVVLDPSTGSAAVNVTYPGLVSWVDEATGRSKIAGIWDRGRGLGVGYEAKILATEVFEDEVIAGTASVTIETVSSI